MLKITLKLKAPTKTCYRFETGDTHTGTLTTLYLKKTDVDNAGIDPEKGITVTIEEGNENA